MATTDALTIRSARLGDAQALAELVAELGFPASADVLVVRLQHLLDAGEGVLVAIDGSDIVGLLTFHVTPVLHRPTPVGRITMLIVTQVARGRGIGRALVERAEESLRARGCALVEITSNQRLTDAHAFYQRLGYEITSFRLRKPLTPP
jgi:ribosomal protein S18 acetylase RimI-like enzyme